MDKISLGSLDHNAQIPVSMAPIGTHDEGEALPLHLMIDTARLNARSLLDSDGHLRQGLKLWADGKPLATQVMDDKGNQNFVVDALIPPEAKTITLRLYDEPVVTLNHDGGDFALDTNKLHERLTVSEMRVLSMSEVHPPGVPASRDLFAGFDPAKHAPITDLHTHSSAQLSNETLIQLALKNNLTYPVELLGRLNDPIHLSNVEGNEIILNGGLGMRFSPMEAEGLDCEIQNKPCDVIPLRALSPENLEKLQKQLQIPQDTSILFSDFDREYYRFVNPLVKNPAMTKDMIMAIGKSYAEQGVRYAELSTASMLNLDGEGEPTWFKEMIEATAEVEKEYGVQLRYLIGIPRTFSPQKVMTEIEKVKYAARHPLIAGVDLLGYESNRTEDFSAALNNIATWAKASTGTDLDPADGWNFKRDFTIRVHAGETNKNNGNVRTAVNIAENHGVQVRIAHALNELDDHSMDKKIAKLSRMDPPLVSMEFCPDSNVGYNNVKTVSKVPFKRWIKYCTSWFLGSDGSGAIQTTPTQLALSALAGGVTLEQLEGLRLREEKFIDDKQQAFDDKSNAYMIRYDKETNPADEVFLAGLAEHIKEVSNPQRNDFTNTKLPREFNGKMPILVAGAALDSWGEMNEATHREVERAMRLLVASIDPKQAYFILGRTKAEGVTGVLDKAILDYNDAHPKAKISVLGLTTAQTKENAHSISHLIDLPGDKDSVAKKTIEFMKQSKVPGISIFVGGKTYTSDMISECFKNRDSMHYLLMENAPGASSDWAEGSQPSRKFNNGMTLIQRMGEVLRDQMGGKKIFNVSPFDYQALHELQQNLRDPQGSFSSRLFPPRDGGRQQG